MFDFSTSVSIDSSFLQVIIPICCFRYRLRRAIFASEKQHISIHGQVSTPIGQDCEWDMLSRIYDADGWGWHIPVSGFGNEPDEKLKKI